MTEQGNISWYLLNRITFQFSKVEFFPILMEQYFWVLFNTNELLPISAAQVR